MFLKNHCAAAGSGISGFSAFVCSVWVKLHEEYIAFK
jgi:hypothetical protein